MAICIVCGKEDENCICAQCRCSTDLEKLCLEILKYIPGSGERPVWDGIAAEMGDAYNFRKTAFAVADLLETPRKEYIKILSITGQGANIPKDSRKWFYGEYAKIIGSSGISDEEKLRLNGIALGAATMDYEYERAESIAEQLRGENNLPWQVYHNLIDFYTKTRRYATAEELVKKATEEYQDNEDCLKILEYRISELEEQKKKAAEGKAEYLPNPKQNKEEVQKKYIEFLTSVGVTIPEKRRKKPEAMKKEEYPQPVETRDADFNTFVAFDIETTGINSAHDAIIEIGAIRVKDGVIREREEFTFREFVKPFEKKITPEVTALTGITQEDVADARQMWEVFDTFADFCGEDTLVGYNCMAFDSKFLVRAGRYANRILPNKYFDVMRYAKQYSEKIGTDKNRSALGELAEKLGIENTEAHRALADAVTTAKVFLALRKLDADGESEKKDVLDLDEW